MEVCECCGEFRSCGSFGGYRSYGSYKDYISYLSKNKINRITELIEF
ncbi:hypothetical protein HMPREF3188_01164 [Tissierellia bacterium KA00581]|nr:hypothetical protein HMPREF3188_01164 [Tissierellia bacterium KA00581]